jgi:hypothetical protein
MGGTEMKTPREILLARHQTAVPKLDAIRREMIDGLNHQGTKAPNSVLVLVSWCLGGSNKLWQELVLPSRRIWSGLAAVWVLIFAVNFVQREPASAGKISAAPAMMSLREQQRWMNEPFAEREPVTDAEPPKVFSPKPRTEKIQCCAV